MNVRELIEKLRPHEPTNWPVRIDQGDQSLDDAASVRLDLSERAVVISVHDEDGSD